ncbi:MAG: hypothetical protein ABSA75_01160 [Candidatus Bathyarchaeia archaeon]|jgi:hypothetical protein
MIFKNRSSKSLTIQKIATVALLFIMASTLVISSNMAKAQTSSSSNTPTYAFVVANPNPLGVNQTALVDFWMADVTPNSVGATGDFYSGVTIKITDPNGAVTTKGPFTLNSLADGFFDYVPAIVGNYTFQMLYPGNDFTDININYLSSQSKPFTLVVQQTQVAQLPQTPLPSAYWQRPINAQNYLWSAVSSNWLMAAWNNTGSSFGLGARAFDDGSSYVGEGTSPNSAHILWTSPLTFGGLAGGEYGSAPYYQGASYEQFFQPPVIMNGILYYNTILAQEPSTESNTPSITAVSLQTGQTIFTVQDTSLTFGQIYNYVSPNQAGTFGYLWSVSGSTWTMYDASKGGKILTLVDVPSGVVIPAADGSILVYSLTPNANGYALSLWNSSQAIAQDNNHDPGLSNDYWTWRPYYWQTDPFSNGVVNATGTTGYPTFNQYFQTVEGQQNTNGTMWTVQEPNTAPGLTLSPEFNQGSWTDGPYIVAGNPPFGFGAAWNISSTQPVDIAAYDMATGHLAFTSALNPPSNLPNDFGDTIEQTFMFNGIFYNFIKQTEQWAAWDIEKGGQPIWVSQPYANPWGMYAQSGGEENAYGLFYAAGWDGEIHAYNVTSGSQEFDFHSANALYNTPYGVYPFYGGITVTADGKIFAQTGQHGNGVATMYEGQALYVVNATSGQSLWNMTGWFNAGALADGVWVTQNNYDNQIYAFGKGPSATTVTASPGVGNIVTIQGTVTDQSPGANGTAAIADQYMSQWMAYLYEQQALPSNFPNNAGVQVTFTAIDPNGNIVNVGSATSDSTGHYALKWTPSSAVAGLYTIVATFDGTNSYYGSVAETSISTVSASPTQAPTATPTSVADMYFVPSVIAIIIVIIIVGIVLALLMLRKRP